LAGERAGNPSSVAGVGTTVGKPQQQANRFGATDAVVACPPRSRPNLRGSLAGGKLIGCSHFEAALLIAWKKN
jgi:hypothetical protein